MVTLALFRRYAFAVLAVRADGHAFVASNVFAVALCQAMRNRNI